MGLPHDLTDRAASYHGFGCAPDKSAEIGEMSEILRCRSLHTCRSGCTIDNAQLWPSSLFVLVPVLRVFTRMVSGVMHGCVSCCPDTDLDIW